MLVDPATPTSRAASHSDSISHALSTRGAPCQDIAVTSFLFPGADFDVNKLKDVNPQEMMESLKKIKTEDVVETLKKARLPQPGEKVWPAHQSFS